MKKLKKTIFIISLMTMSMPAFSGDLSLSYFGETLFHPGAGAGFLITLTDGDSVDWYWGPEGGVYIHIRNHVAVFADACTGLRFTAPFGLFLEAEAGLGAMLRIPAGEVYTAGEGGITTKLTANPALIIPLSIGVGYDFSIKTGHDFILFTNLQIFGEYPYNYYVLPHIAAEAGVRFPL